MLTQVIAENKRCLGVGRGGVEIVKQCRGQWIKQLFCMGRVGGVMGEGDTVEIVSVQYSGRDNVPKVGIQ